jgi:hypothetical protein
MSILRKQVEMNKTCRRDTAVSTHNTGLASKLGEKSNREQAMR